MTKVVQANGWEFSHLGDGVEGVAQFSRVKRAAIGFGADQAVSFPLIICGPA